MQRFLVLYAPQSIPGDHHYAEGVVCIDGAVWVRGFALEEGKLFGDMHRLECYLRDNNDLCFYRIQMIDEESSASKG